MQNSKASRNLKEFQFLIHPSFVLGTVVCNFTWHRLSFHAHSLAYRTFLPVESLLQLFAEAAEVH